ncbi:LysR family transcriptional regulator [Bacillus canaveralius]|uniref:LysR family transcriptional regulator n=1 Tax=Bacillus canaveralius TaxID=1403243 RepID=A0A2N5GKN1_9BACI|nr:LysR family transcriptional regulator [Bacillus canaveralius]PLR82077.1 LysR family transcriptional regulator [Bacillus canaveralius]PLR98017.1 LysR family transcriptional regulator [Bacillus canaveralius]RSK54402.1 LysR family transcriptional regulator [Bacillus canaveralius]
MNIEQVEAFIYVSLTGNFSKAGEILFISQPAVSARIRSLENAIGYPLFNRNGKNVSMTQEGETFLPYARSLLQNMQDGVLAIQQKNRKTEGELRISTVLTVSNYILPAWISEFHEAFPQVKLVVHTGHSHNVLDMVLNHEVPIGISRSVTHPQIESIHLYDDEMVLAIYPDHPFSAKKTVSVDEVASQDLIQFNRGSLDWALINNAFHSMKIQPNVVVEVDNIELAKQMVKNKIGIGILPRFSIEDELKTENLNIIKIGDLPNLNRPFQLIYLKDTKIEGILKIFVDFVLKKLALEKN